MSVAIAKPTVDGSLCRAVDGIPRFAGAGIIQLGAQSVRVIRRRQPAPLDLALWVVIEETPGAKPRALSQAPLPQYWSRFKTAGLSCTSMVLAGAVSTAGTAAAPVTGGTSLFLTYLGGAAAVASAAQCGISFGQFVNEFIDPSLNGNFLDNEEWFQAMNLTFDVLGLASLGAGLPQSFGAIQKIIQMQRATGKSIAQILKGLSRPERKKVAEEIARFGNQQMSRSQWKAMVRTGKFPKIFKQEALAAVIKEQLLTALGNVLQGFQSSRDGAIHYTISVVQGEEMRSAEPRASMP